MKVRIEFNHIEEEPLKSEVEQKRIVSRFACILMNDFGTALTCFACRARSASIASLGRAGIGTSVACNAKSPM